MATTPTKDADCRCDAGIVSRSPESRRYAGDAERIEFSPERYGRKLAERIAKDVMQPKG